MPAVLSRRRLLGLGAGVGLGALAGCSTGGGFPGPGDEGEGGSQTRERATCLPRNSLASHRTLAGAPLVYEVNQQRSSFWFDDGFFGQLEGWADTFGDTLGGSVDRWATYGSWTDGGSACDSWHNSGRAFDLAGLRLEDGTEISCRYDRWRSDGAAALALARRRYWTVAAGLHLRFAYVLTYLYNNAHANHIHVDNGRSGADLSQLSTRSEVQVQAIQAITTYRWQQPVELTGQWDSATRRASRAVLEGLGIAGDLTDTPDTWHAFLTASAFLDQP